MNEVPNRYMCCGKPVIIGANEKKKVVRQQAIRHHKDFCPPDASTAFDEKQARFLSALKFSLAKRPAVVDMEEFTGNELKVSAWHAGRLAKGRFAD